MSVGQSPFPGIKSVLVVLSSRAMAYDAPALRNLISRSYPGAAVFFITVSGDALGVSGPGKVDLTIDFTEPKARQSLWFAPRIRSRSRHAVGRKRGWYRKSKYDRIYDEFSDSGRPSDFLASEQWTQRKVLEAAGVHVARQGGTTPDLAKEIGTGGSLSVGA